MDAVSFHFESHGGLGEVRGLARSDEDGLELQFTARDAMFGLVKTAPKSLRVPLEALSSVHYRAGFLWLMPSIEIRVNDARVLDGLPEAEGGRIVLRLRFSDRRDGRAFVSELDMMRSHYRIALLDARLDRLASLTPGREPRATQAIGKPDATRQQPPQSEG
ncbi:MAG: hypothetical protein MEQ07_08895 [Aquimonas sp.]|nr:hypothetical protein [Aquimonas sp.]